ncbi:MAG: ABC transporter substrate-binding protein [Paracoccus sp. (in: a-proteobacteria)]|nr:ABC transporter substrate-binding protein [Paracoccus sp. (in: a-proteobacteria)]
MKTSHILATLLTSAALTSTAFAADMRIGLNEDPDSLDPARSRTFVSSLVYESLCNRLVNTDENMDPIGELATSWDWTDDGMALVMQLREGVVHHDGTAFNAESAKRVLDRNLSLEDSRRKSELASVESVEATGEHELTIHLTAPDVTLVAQLAHHAGRMYSPDAAEAADEAGTNFGTAPVCTGPYSFVERVEGDRIVLEKFADYWEADEYHYDRVIYLPIPDTTVRLANVRAGDLDMIERTAPSDAASIQNDPNLQFFDIVNLGYQGMTINVGNGPRAEGPLGSNKLVRQAVSYAIDREALNQVAFEGLYVPGNQWAAPGTAWYSEDLPVPERNVERARELLEEAGIDGRISFELQTGNSPVAMQAGQMVQAMLAEVGIDVQLRATEFATLLAQNAAGNFDASLQGWSGRIDPDANVHSFVSCEGANNDEHYCNEEVDRLLNEARTLADPAERKALYDEANAILQDELPLIYLYHTKYLYTLRDGIEGFVPYADGIIRLRGISG